MSGYYPTKRPKAETPSEPKPVERPWAANCPHTATVMGFAGRRICALCGKDR